MTRTRTIAGRLADLDQAARIARNSGAVEPEELALLELQLDEARDAYESDREADRDESRIARQLGALGISH